MPTLGAPGENVQTASKECTTCYVSFGQTSSAAPHAAGVIALMLEHRPCLKPTNRYDTRIRDLLINSTEYRTEIEDGYLVTESGYYGRTWNNAWGYGYLDAHAAVAAASSVTC